MTDTDAYSDVIFRLFWLLVHHFSPRLADIGAARFWRIGPDAHYGSLNGVARRRSNTTLIADQWDELLRIAESLATSTVTASNLLRTRHRGPRAWPKHSPNSAASSKRCICWPGPTAMTSITGAVSLLN